jgi:hypothetical protein
MPRRAVQAGPPGRLQRFATHEVPALYPPPPLRAHAHTPASPQVSKAPVIPNVEFRVGEAEATGLEDACCDLVTVAQALHWFNLPVFYAEAARILRPGGVLASWGYATCTLGDPTLDALVAELYDGDLGPYWSPKCVRLGVRVCLGWVAGGGGSAVSRKHHSVCAQSASSALCVCMRGVSPHVTRVWRGRRRLVDAHYAGMEPTNFSDVRRVEVPLVSPMTLQDFLGYLTTWSSYQVCVGGGALLRRAVPPSVFRCCGVRFAPAVPPPTPRVDLASGGALPPSHCVHQDAHVHAVFVSPRCPYTPAQDWKKAHAGKGVPDVIADKFYPAALAAVPGLTADSVLTVTWPVFAILSRK